MRHLVEIKWRFFYSCFSLVFNVCVGFAYKKSICFLFIWPLISSYSILEPFIAYNNPTELFSFNFGVICLFACFFFWFTLWVHFYFFLIKGSRFCEKNILYFLLVNAFCFSVFSFFALFFVVPQFWQFFLGFSKSDNFFFNYFPLIIPYFVFCFHFIGYLFVLHGCFLFICFFIYWRWVSFLSLFRLRKWFFVFIFFIFFLCLPPSFAFIFFVFFCLFIFFEIFFGLFCFFFKINIS